MPVLTEFECRACKACPNISCQPENEAFICTALSHAQQFSLHPPSFILWPQESEPHRPLKLKILTLFSSTLLLSPHGSLNFLVLVTLNSTMFEFFSPTSLSPYN